MCSVVGNKFGMDPEVFIAHKVQASRCLLGPRMFIFDSDDLGAK